MSNTGVTYGIQISTGNSSQQISSFNQGIDSATTKVLGLSAVMAKMGAAAFIFNSLSQGFSAFESALNRVIEPGVRLDTQMHELKAITGATDETMRLIEKSARQTGKTFGVDAAAGVNAYKLLLSQLSPELAKQPAALAAMGNNAAILSKQLGGDMVGATEILTTAMNQYGVSLDDPTQASRTMANMMNIMSAAAREGSAELPAIKSALEQAGMVAKTFNVSFAETNAAIQVLDKAGKKGAEGGVAIRNILTEMGQGAMQPKLVRDEFQKLGIDLDKLSDNSLTFQQRLDLLSPAMNNQALLTKMFGKENVAAAIALIQGSNEMGRYTQAIVGTTTATEMANTVMGSHEEKMNRIWATLKDYGASFFSAIQPMVPAISIVTGGLRIMSDMGGAINAISIAMDTKLGQAIARQTLSMWGFFRSSAASTLGLIRQGAVTAATGAMMLGGYVVSVVSATAAQLGLNLAMNANPFGLIVIGIAAAVGAVTLLIKYWDNIKNAIFSFAKWIINNHPFRWLLDVVGTIFPGFKKAMSELWDWITGKFEALFGVFKKVWDAIKSFFKSDDPKTTPDTSPNGYTPVAGVDYASAAEKNSKIAGGDTSLASNTDAGSNITSGGSKPTNIYITVGKFQDKIEIHAAQVSEGVDQIVNMIDARLMELLNSANALATK